MVDFVAPGTSPVNTPLRMRRGREEVTGLKEATPLVEGETGRTPPKMRRVMSSVSKDESFISEEDVGASLTLPKAYHDTSDAMDPDRTQQESPTVHGRRQEARAAPDDAAIATVATAAVVTEDGGVKKPGTDAVEAVEVAGATHASPEYSEGLSVAETETAQAMEETAASDGEEPVAEETAEHATAGTAVRTEAVMSAVEEERTAIEAAAQVVEEVEGLAEKVEKAEAEEDDEDGKDDEEEEVEREIVDVLTWIIEKLVEQDEDISLHKKTHSFAYPSGGTDTGSDVVGTTDSEPSSTSRATQHDKLTSPILSQASFNRTTRRSSISSTTLFQALEALNSPGRGPALRQMSIVPRVREKEAASESEGGDQRQDRLLEHEFHVEERMEALRREGQKLHSSFKSVRRSSVAPTASMMQVLEARAKEDALLHAQATASQARVHASGRMLDSSPAEKRSHQGERNIAYGLDATLGFEASLEVFKAHGKTDDLIRPENNQQGSILPASRELLGHVMQKAEAERVELLLSRHATKRPIKLTVPRTPRLGNRPSARGSSSRGPAHVIPPYRAAQTDFLSLSPDWQHKTTRRLPGAKRGRHSPAITTILESPASPVSPP
uniref:Uncharacterized protein n=1 Tax=Haptolina brevifila TaxID=156173 RepID=A0A7S2NKX9_9EUKA|mmetsp:Transcript_80750/g.160422  ORF Transcript_80750/g.160422 Transcript_80750/m.160422 type:complete len:611 (+) Transcript_80750:159-1991(+)|eukprot:CAMPEP_0174695366 /NCGR_PEP_ID=MMETSP1094-20130205/1746_1 /TAXON_ID=156173 /ORGANISM="Chrysochromulina brevifilum, Strain UTEX LB 985" /LENGTH=610 /DNA_ID=CAMNT_0015891839 /DNA_START=155 /DNA_END=1987 /DNA_ORIENTATION=-